MAHLEDNPQREVSSIMAMPLVGAWRPFHADPKPEPLPELAGFCQSMLLGVFGRKAGVQ